MPPTPKLKVDDLVELLLDTRVVEALAKTLAPFISLTINEAINKKIADLQNSVRELKKETSQLKVRNTQLAADNTSLIERIASLESYSKADNLIIRGLPECSAADMASASPSQHDNAVLVESHRGAETAVLDLCRDTLGINIELGDISVAHRIKAGPKDKHRPIIVR